MQKPIHIDEALWTTAVDPEGILDCWFLPDGARVKPGDLLAQVRIEGACHELIADSAGRLRVLIGEDEVVQPGCVIGEIG